MSLNHNYFWHRGSLYRELDDWEKKRHDKWRREEAIEACRKFLKPEFELGDEVFSSHVNHSKNNKPRSCILFERTLHGFGTLLVCDGFRHNLFDEEALVRQTDRDPLEFERVGTNGWGLKLERKCPLTLDELLCHDHEDFRELGKNIVEDRELRAKIVKMSKAQRIKMFMTRHIDDVLEYAVSCPTEERWYRTGLEDGYHEAVKELDQQPTFYEEY